jgi:hypothetical protein
MQMRPYYRFGGKVAWLYLSGSHDWKDERSDQSDHLPHVIQWQSPLVFGS